MQVNIIDLNNNSVLFEKEYPANFASERGLQESDTRFSGATGEIRLAEYWFEGMHIMETDLLQAAPSNVKIQADVPVYTLMCCMEGSISGRIPGQQGRDFALNAQQGTFLAFPTYAVEIGLLEPAKIVCVRLTEASYGRLILMKNQGSPPSGVPIIELIPAMQIILNSLVACQYAGAVKRIFMEAKTLELVALLLARQCPIIARQLTSLPKNDMKSIHLAQQLIEQNIRKPYSILELAHKVGLNDFKLKKGFKQVLGTTVFGYLYNIRMEKAWQLLADEKRMVNDVAYEVGYKNTHHFSAAFKKKYGILPSQINK
ncbi:helix-turn-helix transcriptional regulator [Parapedobacter koreensis]|uniref:AraC-type DNA-binding protein n=1 Tax=Parapedobacter koreensis TaxID=332977 RepID=A0A1H7FX80_9SPHI|nr:AraC family transcriptional regulator [Parapedobacter koreensis]SEK30521.1 AraC-type DNA-binding protein [Parapedobacter koreensis]